MTIIKIAQRANGSHLNRTTDSGLIPDGWAVCDPALENFPFGSCTVENVDGIPTVTGWIPGTVPTPVQAAPTELEQLRADVDYILMMMEG